MTPSFKPRRGVGRVPPLKTGEGLEDHHREAGIPHEEGHYRRVLDEGVPPLVFWLHPGMERYTIPASGSLRKDKDIKKVILRWEWEYDGPSYQGQRHGTRKIEL